MRGASIRAGRWPALVSPIGLCSALLLVAGSTHAVDPDFQDFFFAICDRATGELGERCGESDGGDLSGNSETSLNPSQTLSSTDASVAAAEARSEQLRERAERARSGEALPEAEAPALALGPFSLLLNGRYGSEERDREVDVDEERGYENDIWSIELGLDYRLSEAVVLGAWLAWEQSDLEFDQEQPAENFVPAQNAGAVDREGLGVSAFLSVQMTERSYLDLSAGYVDTDYDLRRQAIFQDADRQVQALVRTEADTDGRELWAVASAGYLAETGGWGVGPYVSLTWADSEVDSYQEQELTGTGLGLSVDDVDQQSLTGTLGVRLTRAVSRANSVLIPQLRAEYVHEFDRDALDSTVAFQLDPGAATFDLEGDAPDRDYFNVNAGLLAVLPNGWMPFLEVHTRLGERDVDRYRVVGGLRVEL